MVGVEQEFVLLLALGSQIVADLDFVLEHVNDLDEVFALAGDEVIAVTNGRKAALGR